MVDKSKTVSQFFKDNLWNILVAVFTAIIGFIWLKADVAKLNYRVDAIEVEQAEYPSKDWFELKFNTIDDRFIQLEKKITNCNGCNL